MTKQPNKNTKVKKNAQTGVRRRRSKSMNPFATKLSAHVTDEGEWITEPPNLTLSRMFLVVLLLHIVIVGGILAFEMFKEESVAPAPSASVTPLTESRDSLGAGSDIAGGEARRYRVQAGDTLSRIASIHNVTTAQVTGMNRLGRGDQIYPGQMLMIPARRGVTPRTVDPTPKGPDDAGGGAEVVPAAVAGDAGPLMEVFPPNVGTGSPLPARGVAPEAPAPTVVSVPPVESPKTHRVESGETAYAISRRYGVTVDALLRENGIAEAKLLRAGNVLRIP